MFNGGVNISLDLSSIDPDGTGRGRARLKCVGLRSLMSLEDARLLVRRPWLSFVEQGAGQRPAGQWFWMIPGNGFDNRSGSRRSSW